LANVEEVGHRDNECRMGLCVFARSGPRAVVYATDGTLAMCSSLPVLLHPGVGRRPAQGHPASGRGHEAASTRAGGHRKSKTLPPLLPHHADDGQRKAGRGRGKLQKLATCPLAVPVTTVSVESLRKAGAAGKGAGLGQKSFTATALGGVAVRGCALHGGSVAEAGRRGAEDSWRPRSMVGLGGRFRLDWSAWPCRATQGR